MSDNRNDLPAPSAPNFNQRLRETVQTFLGRQGNPLDRALTLRDLVDTGVLKLRAGFQLKPGLGSSIPLEPGDGVVDTYEPDLTPPPTPGSMTVTASISHVMIEHDAPLYRQGHGHLRTRVYGKVVNTGDPLPTFADAAEIGQFSGTVYAQPSNPATTWRLWIKWETVDGVLSTGPAGGINGLEAVTGRDVAKLVAAMTGPGNPFKVVTESITLPDGTVVPAGTYTADAYIHDGQIVNAKIGNLAVDDGKIANLSVSKLTAGTLSVGQWIASTNYNEGVGGWAINSNGTAEFGAASIRGQLAASQIDTEGLTIKHDGQVILGAGSSLPAQFVTPDGGWLNSNLVPSINDAATTSSWSGVSGAGKPADGATAGSNLVIKSTFSDGNAGSWNANAVNATAHGGVGEIQCVSRDTLETGNDFAVTPGETLFYAADIWTGGSSYPATAGVMISNSAGVVIAYQGASALPAGQDWTRVTGHGVMPTGAVNATPWVQIDGPGGQVLPYVAFSKIYVGRQQEGATVGANSSNLTIGVGVNLLPNSNFLNGSLEGWGKGDGWPNNEWGTGLAGWDLDGNESTAYLHQTTGYVDNWTGDLYATRVPVVAGTRYEAYAYTGSHRALLQVLVAWYNSSGTYLGENGVGTNDEEVGGGTALSGYKKTGGFALAPAGAATAMFFIRKHSTKNGYGDSWAFISRAFFGEALPGQTELSPWSPGAVQGVKSLGYSGDLNATYGATQAQIDSIDAKLSKAGDTISGRISFTVADGMFAGGDTNNGVYFGKDGLVGRKNGVNTFYINTAGDAVFSGTLDAATMNSGRINLQHSGDWDWGYARSYDKWWDDGQNGWVLARHADGSTFMEMRGGSNRIWMSSWDDCGIEFPGISMTNGGLTISQANVINTLQLAGNAVTVSNQATGTAQAVSTTLSVPPNTTMAITAVASIDSFISEDTSFINWAVPQISVSINGSGISDTHQYQVESQGENWTDYTIYATSISYGKSVTNSSESPIAVVITVTGSAESDGASKSITAFGFKR